MRLLTYNLWHGLSPSSTPLVFDALEPTGRRELRELAQLELLRELKPDLCFFQEVNPVGKRAPKLAAALGAEVEFQPDLVGLKLFGIGIPLNLNSGLAILSTHGLRRLEAVSLDRKGVNLVHSWASWQLSEERFALLCEAMLPGWGRVLLIDTHLHHGLEATPDFLERIDKAAEELQLSPAVVGEIRDRLGKGSERRAHEIDVLLEAIHRHEARYEVVIVAGDFNTSPESEAALKMRQAGFRDVWAEAHADGGGLTFDGSANEANHLLQKSFPLTPTIEDLSFSAKTKETLIDLFYKQEHRPRRIDYIWLKANSLSLKVSRAEMAGLPDKEGLAPSDHFALVADLGVER